MSLSLIFSPPPVFTPRCPATTTLLCQSQFLPAVNLLGGMMSAGGAEKRKMKGEGSGGGGGGGVGVAGVGDGGGL